MTRLKTHATLEDIGEARDNLFHAGSHFEPVERKDIVGIEDILLVMDEIVDWLSNFTKYRQYNTRLEPGVIFEGVPGSGKTLCSRYIATHSKALFVNVRDYPISGHYISSEEVRDLFSRARRYYEETNSPIILFWDEFETVARSRMQAKDGGEKTTSSELTVQLDGISGKCPGLLLIGCTNYFQQVDPALLRAGRMGLHIQFNAPDRKGKQILLDHYLSRFPAEDGLTTDTASYFFNDQDTASKIEEAAELTWRKVVTEALTNDRLPILTNKLINQILLDNFIGISGSFMDLSEEALYQTAIHELGHAVIAHELGIPIRVITIRPYQNALGRTVTYLPDFHTSNIDEIKNYIKVSLGSLVAEKLVGLAPSSGTHGDTKYATDLARRIVESWGQNHLGGFNPEGLGEREESYRPQLGNAVMEAIDGEVVRLLQDSKTGAEEILGRFGYRKLYLLAGNLLVDSTWTGDDFARQLRQL